MIVVDASAVLELLLGNERGRVVADHVTGPDADAHAPALLDLEVVQVLHRYVREMAITVERGRETVELARILGIRRHQHVPLLRRVWEFRNTLNAYDAAYVALAEGLQCPLLTADRKLAAARLPDSVSVELLS